MELGSVLSQLRSIARSTTDDAARRELMVTLHQLAYSLEDSNDTIHRYGYLHLQTAAVKIGFDLSLFSRFAEDNAALTVQQLAEETKADSLFMSRLLRYLASVGVIDEVSNGCYTGNSVSRNLSEKVAEAGISHCFETIGKQYQQLPSFMKKTAYNNPTNEIDTVFQQAFNTTQHQFEWFSSHQEALQYFNDYMALRRDSNVSWLSAYPVEAEIGSLDPSRAVYVNIGGGIGHQCAQFRERFPALPGKVILQDLPHSIAQALQTSGVENMEHNFFEPQPVKGAKFYFTRGVLHNHPDHKVRQLLEHTKSAMEADSVMLLDEMVLPETGVNAYATSMDLVMMSAFAAMERTESQWQKLIESVGLRLVKTYVYNPISYESVMDVRLA